MPLMTEKEAGFILRLIEADTRIDLGQDEEDFLEFIHLLCSHDACSERSIMERAVIVDGPLLTEGKRFKELAESVDFGSFNVSRKVN